LEERRRRIGENWWATVEHAINWKADLYLHTGDLFDQVSPRNPPRATVIQGFKRLQEAGVSAHIIAGNHEAPATQTEGASPHALLAEAGLAHVYENRLGFEEFKDTFHGVEVHIAGMSFNRKLMPGEDPLEGKTIPAGGDLNIALLHYSIEGIAPPLWEEPTIKKTSLEANQQIQLYAMGHIHDHIETRFYDSLVAYPGATEHFDFGEWEKPTGFLEVEYDGELKTRYVELESQPMRQLRLHTSHLDHQDLTSSIQTQLEKNSHPQGLLQLVLEGELPFPKYSEIRFAEINRKASAGNFYFELVDQITPMGMEMELPPGEGLSPRRRLEEVGGGLAEKAEGEERELWLEALRLALEYYDRGAGKRLQEAGHP